jgi:CheY-like chemotaxis protein
MLRCLEVASGQPPVEERRMAGLSASEPASIINSQRRLPGDGRVLVVEDEPTIRETLQILINIEGCEARGARDATEALALLEEWPPDLILLDLTLPGMSGAEFIQAYHARPEPPPHAPIVLLTGQRIAVTEATEMGAAGLLPKPFDANDLLDVVASFTDCGGD